MIKEEKIKELDDERKLLKAQLKVANEKAVSIEEDKEKLRKELTDKYEKQIKDMIHFNKIELKVKEEIIDKLRKD